MNRRINLLFLPLLCFLLLPHVRAFCTVADESKSVKTSVSDDAEYSRTWQILNTIVETSLAEHLRPPTRQEMYLAAARAFYGADKTMPPGDLTETFSELNTDQGFQEQLAKIWKQQRDNDVAASKLANSAMASVLRCCGDGVHFVAEKDNRVNKQIAENQYVGIGIRVGQKDGYPQIHEPYYGGAAQKAGARKGDLIIAVEGVPSKGRNFREIIDHLRGEKGSAVKVTLRHEDETDEREYTMVRAVVPISSVVGHKRNDDGQWALDLPGKPEVAYLRVESIVGSTAAELAELGRKIEKANFDLAILDFSNLDHRMAPDIHHAIMVADTLVGEAKIGELMTRQNKNQIHTQSEKAFTKTPVLVLTPEAVSGPTFLVLSALKHHSTFKLAGSQALTTDGLCKKSVDMEGIGAIGQLPYGQAIPNLPQRDAQQNTHARNLHDVAPTAMHVDKFALYPDKIVATASNTNELVTKALAWFSSNDR